MLSLASNEWTFTSKIVRIFIQENWPFRARDYWLAKGAYSDFFLNHPLSVDVPSVLLPQSTRGQPVWTWAGKEKSYNFDDGFNTNNGKTSFVQFRHMVYKPSEFLVWVSSSSRQMKCYIIWLEESWLLPTTMRVKIYMHGALFDTDDHSQNWLVLVSHDL